MEKNEGLIKSSENLSLSPILGAANNALSSAIEQKTDLVAQEKIKEHSEKYENCDFYQKLDVQEIKQIVKDEMGEGINKNKTDDLDDEIDEFIQIKNKGKDESTDEIDDFVEIKNESTEEIDDFVEIKNDDKGKEEVGENSNLQKPPSKRAYYSSLFANQLRYLSSSYNYMASGLANATKPLWQVPERDSLIVQKNPLVHEAYALVKKMLPFHESKDWENLLLKIPEAELKEMIVIFKEFTKLYAYKLNDLMGIENDENIDLTDKLTDLMLSLQQILVKLEIKGETKLTYEIFAPIQNTNHQVFCDVTLRSTRFIKENATTERYANRVKSCKEEASKTDNISLQYLAKQDFKKLSNSIYSSTIWKMELGEEKGVSQQFQKGYCKILLAFSGKDIREIRIPFDLRFLKLETTAEAEVIFEILGEVLGADLDSNQTSEFYNSQSLQKAISRKYLAKVNKSLEKNHDVEKEIPLFLEKCRGPQGDCRELIETFKSLNEYSSDMLQKAFSSLGRDYVHFKGVVSHFEVFPKEMINHLLLDKAFKKQYNFFIGNLYIIRDVLIREHLKGEKIDRKVFDSLLPGFDNNYKDLLTLINSSSLSNNEKHEIKKYIKYMIKLSISSWNETSQTQISMIDQLLKEFKGYMFVKSSSLDPGTVLSQEEANMEKEFAKERELAPAIQLAHWLSDPTTCRLVFEYFQYSQLVKNENMATLEKGEKVSMNSYHNKNLHGLTIDLIQNLQDSIEPIDKQVLINVLKEFLRSSLDPSSTSDNVEVKNVLDDIETIGTLVKDWNSERINLSKIDNTKLMNSIKGELGERFETIFIEKYFDFIPKGLPEGIKTEIKDELQKAFNWMKGSAGENKNNIQLFVKILDSLDQLKITRQKEILNLFHPSKASEGEKIRNEFIFGMDPLEGSHLTAPLTALFETFTSASTQIVDLTTALSIHPPTQLVVLDLKDGDIRELGSRYSKSLNAVEEQKDASSDCVNALLKENFIKRNESSFIYSKILWHMEEGELQKNSESRIFKKGYGEISFSIPFLNRTCISRFPIDLGPFNLKDAEEVRSVLKAIADISQKGDLKKCMNSLQDFVNTLKNENKCPDIVDNQELFIQTALDYMVGSAKALNRTLVSVCNPSIHFSDVEEFSHIIPLKMLEEHFFQNEKNKQIWNAYIDAVFVLRNAKMIAYIIPKKSEQIIDLEQFNQVQENLLQAFKETFKNEDDLHVIESYLESINHLALTSWDENVHAIKTIERAIMEVLTLNTKNNSKDLLELRALLFPLLVDGDCLKAFKDWTKALNAAREVNASLEVVNGDEFHNQRLEKKKTALVEKLNSRPEMSDNQKLTLLKWIDLQPNAVKD